MKLSRNKRRFRASMDFRARTLSETPSIALQVDNALRVDGRGSAFTPR
jgi:hypothetical protein